MNRAEFAQEASSGSAKARLGPVLVPKRIALGVAVWLSVTLVATLLALAINYAATLVPRAPIRAHLADAVASEMVILPYRNLEMNVRTGPHQFNDCLVLNMIVDDRGGRLERALSPIHGFGDGGSPCDALANPPTGPADPMKDNYHRYMHGTVAVDTFLLAGLSVGAVRNLFSWSLTLGALGLLVGGLVLCVRRMRRDDRIGAASAGMIAIAGVGFSLFYGLGSYGYSLTHPPTDLTLLAYLWAALLLDFRKLKLAAWVGLHALFGVITMWFELLHGGIPLGACLILLAWAPYALEAGARDTMWRGISAAIVFGAASILAFSIKIIVTVAVFGPAVLGNMGEALVERVGVASPIALIQAVLANAHYVGAGSRSLGALMILGAVGAAVLAAWTWYRRIRARRMDGAEAAVLAGLAFLAIAGWYLLFLPHAILHASFMVRICVGLIIASAVLAAITWREAIARFMAAASAMISERTGPTA